MGCSVDKCGKLVVAKGLCSTHYRKIKRTGTLDRLVFGEEWKRKQSEAHRTDLTKIDMIKDPGKGRRGFLAVNVVNDIKYKARQRGKEWSLSNMDAYKIIISECHYCGHIPDWPKSRNGIDRVNNAIGYTPTNSVPCCFTCNSAKGQLSSEEFKAWILRIHTKITSK